MMKTTLQIRNLKEGNTFCACRIFRETDGISLAFNCQNFSAKYSTQIRYEYDQIIKEFCLLVSLALFRIIFLLFIRDEYDGTCSKKTTKSTGIAKGMIGWWEIILYCTTIRRVNVERILGWLSSCANHLGGMNESLLLKKYLEIPSSF